MKGKVTKEPVTVTRTPSHVSRLAFSSAFLVPQPLCYYQNF